MANQLAVKLRALCRSFSGNYDIRLLAGESADEIERLERELIAALRFHQVLLRERTADEPRPYAEVMRDAERDGVNTEELIASLLKKVADQRRELELLHARKADEPKPIVANQLAISLRCWQETILDKHIECPGCWRVERQVDLVPEGIRQLLEKAADEIERLERRAGHFDAALDSAQEMVAKNHARTADEPRAVELLRTIKRLSSLHSIAVSPGYSGTKPHAAEFYCFPRHMMQDIDEVLAAEETSATDNAFLAHEEKDDAETS